MLSSRYSRFIFGIAGLVCILDVASADDLIPVNGMQIDSCRSGLPATHLPRSQWISTNFDSGSTAIYTVGQNGGVPVRREARAAITIRCMAGADEIAQNLPGGQKLLPGQALVINESVQYCCH